MIGPKVQVNATLTANADNSENAAPAAAKHAGTTGLAADANAYKLGKDMGHTLASGLKTDALSTLKSMVDTQMYSLGKAMGPILAKVCMVPCAGVFLESLAMMRRAYADAPTGQGQKFPGQKFPAVADVIFN